MMYSKLSRLFTKIFHICARILHVVPLLPPVNSDGMEPKSVCKGRRLEYLLFAGLWFRIAVKIYTNNILKSHVAQSDHPLIPNRI